ncbi:hypothetical protein PIROE2DRAFT_3273, partial [Piromyces sp. E2]
GDAGALIKCHTNKICICNDDRGGMDELGFGEERLNYKIITPINASFPVLLKKMNPYVTLLSDGIHLNEKVIGKIQNSIYSCTTKTFTTTCKLKNPNYGYYVNASTKHKEDSFLACSFSGCKSFEVDIDAECTKQNVGQLIGTAPSLCLLYYNELDMKYDVNLSGDSRVGYMVGFNINNVFGIEKNYFALVDVTKSSVELRSENESVVKFGKDGSVTLLSDGIHLNEKVIGKIQNSIYSCTTKTFTTTCKLKNPNYGYYVNASTKHKEDSFLACSFSGCKSFEVDIDAECTKQNVGQLIGTAPSLCLLYYNELDMKYDVNLSGDSRVGYMVGFNINNVFGIEKNYFALVDVTKSSVELRSVYQQYVYTESDTLKEKEESVVEINDETENIYEFKLNNEDVYGIYKLNCVSGKEKNSL